ncbi:transposase [Streptomyces sp. NBRC 110611]|nr:transposase [Streptomyces sp. NBRC 110611]
MAPGRGELEQREHRAALCKADALTGPDKRCAETSMLALHLLQSAPVHASTLLVLQVLAEPAWAKS